MIRKTSLNSYIGITIVTNLIFGCAQLQKVDLKKVKEKSRILTNLLSFWKKFPLRKSIYPRSNSEWIRK